MAYCEQRIISNYRRLSMTNINKISILYLAKYAPDFLDQEIPKNINDVVYAEYHKKIYEILRKNFDMVISSRDPGKLLNLDNSVDYIFSLYNKFDIRNSEIFVSALSEYHKIPYLGATPNIRALAEDKHLAKMLAKHAGIPTAKWQVYNVHDPLIAPNFEPPFFVKPRFGAASVGIDESSICDSWFEATEKIKKFYKEETDVILEQQLKGIYYTCPVLNNFDSPIFLTPIKETSILKDNVVTYEQKRKITGGLDRVISFDKDINQAMLSYSKKIFSLVQPLDYTRFDFIVDDLGTPYFLEFNVCCNLGEKSTVAQSALHSNISYEDLLLNIVYSSLFRQNVISETFNKKL